MLAGLLYKAGAVPAHFWVPDAVSGATVPAAAFATTIPKIGAVVGAYRLMIAMPAHALNWQLLIAILAAANMTLGNLAAYRQDDPKRLLAYSTISQVGYLLVPVAVAGRSDLALPSLLLYLTGYTVTNLAAFAVTTALPDRRDLDSYRGMGRSRPWLGASLAVALLGLVGTPPTVVFVGKLTTTAAAWDGGHAWLAVLVFLNTVVSLFYYLRWIRAALRPATQRGEEAGTGTGTDGAGGRGAPTAALVAAFATVVMGVAAGPLWLVLA